MYHSYSNSKSFYLLISFTSVKSYLCTTIIVLEYSVFDYIFIFTSEFYTFIFFMLFMSFLSIWKTFKKFYKARLVMIDTLFLFLEYSSTGYIIFFLWTLWLYHVTPSWIASFILRSTLITLYVI